MAFLLQQDVYMRCERWFFEKKAGVIALCVGIAVLMAIGCTTKRDRLADSTLVVSVEPSFVSLSTGTPQRFAVLARSAGAADVTITPTWSLSAAALGTIAVPETGASVLFVSGAASGSGKIYADYHGVRGEATIQVVPPVTGGSGGGGTIYGIYSETYTEPTYMAIRFDTANPPDTHGGYIGAWGSGVLATATGLGEYSDGVKSIKCSIGGTIGGWWMQFGYDGATNTAVATDMSTYAGGKLKFDVRSTKDISIKVEWSGGSAEKTLSSLGVALDDNWHSVEIPLSSFSGIVYTAITIPAGFHAGTTTSFSYYIDNVRWEY